MHRNNCIQPDATFVELFRCLKITSSEQNIFAMHWYPNQFKKLFSFYCIHIAIAIVVHNYCLPFLSLFVSHGFHFSGRSGLNEPNAGVFIAAKRIHKRISIKVKCEIFAHHGKTNKR